MRDYLSTKDPDTKKERGAIYVENVFKFAAKGDATAIKLIANYIDGMPKQDNKLDLTSNGEKISFSPHE